MPFEECPDCSAHFWVAPDGNSEVASAPCPNCGGKRLYMNQPNPTQSDMVPRDMVDPKTQEDKGGNPLFEGVMAHLADIAQFCPECNEPVLHGRCPNCGTFVDGPNQGLLQPEIANEPLSEGTIMGKDGESPAATMTNGRDNYMHGSIKKSGEEYPDTWDEYTHEEPEDFPMSPSGFNQGDPVVWGKNNQLAEFIRHDPEDTKFGLIKMYHAPPGSAPSKSLAHWVELDELDHPTPEVLPAPDFENREFAQHPDPWMDNEPGSMTFPRQWAAKTAGPMEEIVGLENPQANSEFLRWQPGMHGRGIMINGEPHTWNVFDPQTARGPEDFIGPSHSEYVRQLGINPDMADFGSGVEIRPTGDVEPLTGRDPSPYIAADPRLKVLEGDLFSSPIMSSVEHTLNTELYPSFEHQSDVLFDQGPDQNVPQHSITVTPGPTGIHAGHTKYLNFLDAHVNGQPVRGNAGEIIRRYGFHDSPEFGRPVTISVHSPDHIDPIREQIEQGNGAQATPLMRNLGHRIQSGQLPPPPGIDPSTIAPPRQSSVHTAGPALAIGGDALMGAGAEGAAGMSLGDVAPSLMRGALMGTGSHMVQGLEGSPGGGPAGDSAGPSSTPPNLEQLSMILVSDYETMNSVHDIDEQEDDPEKQDQKEFDDGDKSPSNFKNPNLEDSGQGWEDEKRKDSGFAPDSKAIERLGLLMPLVLHFFQSEESGAGDPMIRGLHEMMEEESPGYLDHSTPEGEDQVRLIIQERGKKKKKESKTAEWGQSQMQKYLQGLKEIGNDPSGMPAPDTSSQIPSGGLQQQGHCQNCGGTLEANGACPQCGNNEMMAGGSGSASMPPGMPHSIASALVLGADHQGPVTPEQIAAVQQLLIEEGRVNEVPNVPLEPSNFAKEMAQIQQVPNVAPQPNPGEVTPPAPIPAPGSMPAPGMGPEEAGGQPMQPMSRRAADNVARRCPNCNSATTGMLNQDGWMHCHGCGENFKNDTLIDDNSSKRKGSVTADQHPSQHQEINPSAAPADEQHSPEDFEGNQDSSLTWKDDSGRPLKAGDEYEMHNPNYDIPDMVKVMRVKPDGIDVQITGTFSNEPNAMSPEITITKREVEMEHLTFSAPVQEADERGNEPPGGQAPGYEQVPPSGQTTDEETNSAPVQSSISERTDPDSCERCGYRHIESSLSSPTTTLHECWRCGHAWETNEEDFKDEHTANRAWLYDSSSDDDFFANMERVQAMRSANTSSRNIQDIASKDPRLQQIKDVLDANKRTAGKKFTPQEQRELIDEEGVARNLGDLDLSGTHYRMRDDWLAKTGMTRDADPELVPDSHLLLGL